MHQKRSGSSAGEKSVLPLVTHRTRIPEYVYSKFVFRDSGPL
jgi:hypothetical protein